MTPAESLRVLVVEDEALILMSTLDMLEELGHRGLAARSGAAAIAALTDDATIDAAITDVNLPDVDGIALAAELRRRRPGLPIVFATGYQLTVTGDEAGEGPSAVLSKPYFLRELAAALRAVMSGPVMVA
jgi:CheY-like chemotaxis protein